jgi:Flp pilus assembly protein TadG
MRFHLGRPSTGRHRSRGQALVEFALVIPVFILVLSGILDFGFMLFSRMTVINAAREGARVAAMTSDPGTMVAAARSRAISAGQSAGMAIASGDVTVECLQTTSASYSASTRTPKCTWTLHTDTNTLGAQTGDSVSVKVDYTYRTFFPLLFGTSFTLSSTVQMVLDNVATG